VLSPSPRFIHHLGLAAADVDAEGQGLAATSIGSGGVTGRIGFLDGIRMIADVLAEFTRTPARRPGAPAV
jgi:hypothetical protein